MRLARVLHYAFEHKPRIQSNVRRGAVMARRSVSGIVVVLTAAALGGCAGVPKFDIEGSITIAQIVD